MTNVVWVVVCETGSGDDGFWTSIAGVYESEDDAKAFVAGTQKAGGAWFEIHESKLHSILKTEA